MTSHWTGSSPKPCNGTELHVAGVLLDHEGRISTVETLLEERKPEKPRFEIKDLGSWLPGLVALALALLGKITWMQYLGIGLGH